MNADAGRTPVDEEPSSSGAIAAAVAGDVEEWRQAERRVIRVRGRYSERGVPIGARKETMSGIPSCPVCDAIDDCEHCLVEWHGSPGQRFRGVAWGLIDRIEERVADLLVECSLAHVPPRQPALNEEYRAALEIVAGFRAEAEVEIEDEEASAQAYLTAPVDREELRGELIGLGRDFAIQSVRQLPGVSEIVFGDLVSEAQQQPEWVSLWSADPGEVQRRLLDLLAPIEVQLEQFRFGRGEKTSGR
jgi:hypothetical protein